MKQSKIFKWYSLIYMYILPVTDCSGGPQACLFREITFDPVEIETCVQSITNYLNKYDHTEEEKEKLNEILR